MTTTASIEKLVEDGIVDEVVQRVKTGKEAEVFVVRKGTDFLAAKVYKERTQRNFKNNVGYMEGRSVRNSRDMRAMEKRTKYGVRMAEDEWMHTEHDALATVAAAGVRVPRPELFYEGVLLMELVLGPDGQPAPRLIDVPMTPEEAIAAHHDVVSMIVKMLCCDLIHGDLSPYNILVAWNGCTIIDLPQVVKAAHNSQSESFLVRDVRNVTDHFSRSAPELRKRLQDGHQIWRKYMRRELTPDFFPEEGQSFAPKQEFTPGQQRPHRGPRHDQRPDRPREHRAPREPRPHHPSNGHGQAVGATSQPHPAGPGPRPPHHQGPRPQGQGPRAEGPRNDRPRTDGPRNDRPRNDRPRNDRPLNDRPRSEQPRNDRPRADGPRNDRPRSDGPRNEPPRTEGPRNDRPRIDRPRNDRPRSDPPGTDRQRPR